MFTSAFLHLTKDFRAIPAGVKFLVMVIFLRSMGWGFADPFFSLYLKGFSPDYAQIGLLASVTAFTSLLAIIPLMRLSDKIQEPAVIRDGEVLYIFVVFAYLLAGIFKNIPLLIFALALGGVAQTLIVVGTEAYIRKHDGHGRSGPFGYYVALDYFGWILGMLLAAYAVQWYTFNTMFLFVLPGIAASFFILPLVKERGIRSLIAGFKRYLHTRQDFTDLISGFRGLNPKMTFFLLIAFFDGVIRMFVYVFIPLFAVSLNLDLKTVALLMVAMYFPFIFSYFFSEISDFFGKMRMIAAGLFLSSLSFSLLYFLVNRFWVIFLAAMISLSISIVRPAYNTAITRLTPRGRMGQITGLNNFAERIGRIAGPILTGVAANHFGLSSTFLMISVAAFGLGMISFLLKGMDPDLAAETRKALDMV